MISTATWNAFFSCFGISYSWLRRASVSPYPTHYIGFIVLVTSIGMQMKWLKPRNKTEAIFKLAEGEKTVSAYEYCNLHGLWMAEA